MDLPTFGLKTYCTSPHYTVYGRIEDIYVSDEESRGSVKVGWFAGTPSDAAMSDDERWLVSVGQGFIAYRMQPPWHPYDSAPSEGQWFEGGREPGNELRFRSVQPLDAHNFLLRSIDNHFVVTEHLLNADTEALTKVSEWVEEQEKWRAGVLDGFTDLQLMRIYGGVGRLVLEFRGSGMYEDTGKYQVDLSGQIEVCDARATMDSGYSDTYDLQDVAQAARAKHFFRLHANGRGSISDVPTLGCVQLLLRRRPHDSRDASGRVLRDTPSIITLRSRGRFASWLVRTPRGTIMCPGLGGWLEGPAQTPQEPTEKATIASPRAPVAPVSPADFPQVPQTRDEILVRLDAFLEAYQRDPTDSGLYFVAPGLPGRHLAVFKRQSAFELTVGPGFPNSRITTEPLVANSWLMQRGYTDQGGIWTRSSSVSLREAAAEILDLFQSAWGAMELEAPTLITGSHQVQGASRSFGQLALAPPGVSHGLSPDSPPLIPWVLQIALCGTWICMGEHPADGVWFGPPTLAPENLELYLALTFGSASHRSCHSWSEGGFYQSGWEFPAREILHLFPQGSVTPNKYTDPECWSLSLTPMYYDWAKGYWRPLLWCPDVQLYSYPGTAKPIYSDFITFRPPAVIAREHLFIDPMRPMSLSSKWAPLLDKGLDRDSGRRPVEPYSLALQARPLLTWPEEWRSLAREREAHLEANRRKTPSSG